MCVCVFVMPVDISEGNSCRSILYCQSLQNFLTLFPNFDNIKIKLLRNKCEITHAKQSTRDATHQNPLLILNKSCKIQ